MTHRHLYGFAIIALFLLNGCDNAPFLAEPSNRVPARLELDVSNTSLYTGESSPLKVRLYDQNDEPFEHIPSWIAPQWSSGTSIIRLNNNRIEAFEPGLTSLTVSIAGLSDTKTVRVNPGALLVNVAGAYITQGIQRFDGTVPLVAGRSGVLRVFVTGDQTNFFRPSVRARFFNGTTQVGELTATATSEGVPGELAEGFMSRSWNFPVSGSLIQSGYSYLVEVQSDGGLRPGSGSTLRFPANGTPRTMDVRNVPTFRITFVPINIINFATGDVTPSNVNYYMGRAREVWPFNQTDVIVREPYSTTTRSLTDDDWEDLLSEIRQLRILEGSTRYYHGILRREGAWAGLGYVGYPAAISQDGASDWTVAHELGHNFGRRHAPCGGPAGVDASYPHSGGAIGVYGLAPDGITVYPPTRADLMTYCSPRWVSDYTYMGVLNFRGTVASLSANALTTAKGKMLIVSGRVGPNGAKINPVFTFETEPALPLATGPNTLEGFDASGGSLFRFSFAGEELGDGPTDERHFGYAIPITDSDASRLARVVLRGAGQSAERSVTTGFAALQGAGATTQTVSAVATSSNTVSVTWNAAAYPQVVVRNPATGSVIAMLSGGNASIKADVTELELIASDGVRSVVSTVRVR